MIPALDGTLLSRVEDAGINASAPPQQRWFDGWLVRFSPGKAKRARCIYPVAAGRLSLDDKLESSRRFYEDHSLPMIVRVAPFSQPTDIAERLAALGFDREDETCVMVSTALAQSGATGFPSGFRIEPLSHHAMAQTVGEFRGTPSAQREAHAERLQASPTPYRAAAVVDSTGAAVACAQYAREGEVVGLYDVFTAEGRRGLGLASTLCEHLLNEAYAGGARVAYLQVEQANDAAQRVYRRLGFAVAYTYHYRVAPSSLTR